MRLGDKYRIGAKLKSNGKHYEISGFVRRGSEIISYILKDRDNPDNKTNRCKVAAADIGAYETE